MIIVNIASGETIRFDISDPDDDTRLSDLAKTGQITAISIHHNGQQHTLTNPKRFRSRCLFGAELLHDNGGDLVGVRIFVQAEAIRASLAVLYDSCVVRYDLAKTGRMQYNPHGRKRRR